MSLERAQVPPFEVVESQEVARRASIALRSDRVRWPDGEEADYRVVPPRVDVVSAVGAGDAFTSGLIAGLVREHAWEPALALAAAAGAATCLTAGTMMCRAADVKRLRAAA